METSTLDYVIIFAFLIGIAVIGSISGGRQKTVTDYFLGSRQVSWWTVCFSIIAAETSTLTFISIPGLAYLTNLNFLQVTFGYLIGRIIVAKYFLPAYYKGELKTAYSYLEHRFGSKTRTFASIVFILTRTAADGVRLFATAIPLYLLLNIDPLIAIIMIAIIALIYTYTGGLKGVIKVDVILMFLYIGSAVLAAVYLINLLPDGWTSVIHSAATDNKFSIINFAFKNGIDGFLFRSIYSHRRYNWGSVSIYGFTWYRPANCTKAIFNQKSKRCAESDCRKRIYCDNPICNFSCFRCDALCILRSIGCQIG